MILTPPTDTPPRDPQPQPPSPSATPPVAPPAPPLPTPPGPLTRARARKLAEALICAIITCPDDVDDLTEDAIFHLADLGWLPSSSSSFSSTGSAQSGSSPVSTPGGSSSASSRQVNPAAAARAKRAKPKIMARMARRIVDFLSPGSRPDSYAASGMPSRVAASPTFPVGSRIRATRSLLRGKKK